MKWVIFCILIWAKTCAGDVIYFTRDLSPQRVAWAQQLAAEVTEVTGVEIAVKPLPFWGVRGKPWLVLSPRLFLRPLADQEPFAQISVENEIAAWIQQSLGVRWLVPGEIERVPQALDWTPFAEWREVDAATQPRRYLQRRFLGVQGAWGARNGLMPTPYNRSHALHEIIRPEQFDTHPNRFAKRPDGTPMRPPFAVPNLYNDQPDLLDPDVVELVVAAAIAAFEADPTRQLFSILPNDSYVFGHIPESHAHLRPSGYFGGWPDYSDYVYDFGNRVAKEVGAIFPNRLLTLSAYMMWLNVPSFPVHPNILVTTAADRTQWYDADFKAQDLDLINRWLLAGPRWQGAVDYIFSGGFFIPRSLTQIVSDSIPLFYEKGLRAYTSFVGPNWAYDAHTNWLAAQLLWDVTQDPEALLEEFFALYYGPAAAPMRAFFDLAEEAWMTQGGTARWLKYWRNPNQVELLLRDSERIPAMEAQLVAAEEVALGDAENERFARRVGYTRSMWEVTKTVVALQEARWAYTRTAARHGAEFSHGGTEGTERLRYFGERIGDLEAEIVKRLDAMVASDVRFSNLWERDWLFQEDPRVRKFEGRSVKLEERKGDPGWLMLSGFGDFERAWRVNNVAWEGALIEKRGEVIYAENVARGQIATAVAVEAGNTYRIDVGFRGKLSPSAFVHVSAQFFDAGWQQIYGTKWDRLPPGEYAEPILLGPVVTAPEGSRFMRLFIRLFEMAPGDWLEVGDPVAVWEKG